MADLLRVSIKGTLPTGEEWSVNPIYSVGGDFGTPVSAAQALTIATAINAAAVPSNLVALWNAGTALTGFRVEARSKLGVLESQAEVVRTSALVGTGSQPHPFQTSIVSSLRTTLPGASGRGRLYWPATAATIDANTLRMGATGVTNTVGAVKTFLSAIQTAIDVTLDGVALAVWSRKNSSLTAVNSIQVGNVFDVQRRRRDSLVENYTALSYP